MVYQLNHAAYAILIAFAANIILCPVIIPYLTKLKFGQNVRNDGPQTHIKKSGTPTMGGIMIILSLMLASLFFLKNNSDALILIFVTISFAIIGFFDDYIKVVKKRSLGLRAYQKIIAQLLVTTVFIYYMMNFSDDFFGSDSTSIIIPFTDGLFINLGIFYIPFVYIVMIGTVNAVNLTDGLDGLATGVTALVATFFLFAAWAAGSSSVPIMGAAVGSLLGFLLFNAYPARVFMGDTGSLALGGLIATVAILLKMPLFIIIVGIIYLVEALSVIIQVFYFKLTGQRFFKMAPIHHSLEISGWSETKVVTYFYVITAIACLVGFLAAQYIF